LSWFARELQFQAISIDFSTVGNQKTIENFSLQQLVVTVFEKNILVDDLSDIPQADVVYSLGFVEHFSNPELLFEKHFNCCLPGGIIIIGFPNFSGINQRILALIAPKLLEKHVLTVMNENLWLSIAKKKNCEVIYHGYLGGICPRIWYPSESHLIGYQLINLCIRGLNWFLSRWITCLGRINSPSWSAYWLGIFRKP
ncbi:MAG: class I SAM-dependent methyltransferase, partial [Bacteroidia bacterium]|nr:class I SAM-dependent methyltransferase [Bacteroidia bacterium]